MAIQQESYILSLKEVGIQDIEQILGDASLEEMLRHFSDLDIRIPDGFVITAKAFQHFTNAIPSSGTGRPAKNSSSATTSKCIRSPYCSTGN
jgi:phosphoenolpyruvate synthase/pyruvate phosphate dikinase